MALFPGQDLELVHSFSGSFPVHQRLGMGVRQGNIDANRGVESVTIGSILGH